MTNYYYLLSDRECVENIKGPRDTFSISDIEKVKSIFPTEIDYKRNILKIYPKYFFFSKKFSDEIGIYNEICKLKDEWFILSWISASFEVKYYKCDQIEGLLKFFEDIKK